MVVGSIVKQIADNEVRVSVLLSLASGQTHTIALAGYVGVPNSQCPASFAPKPFRGPDGTTVSLQDSISCDVNLVDGGGPPASSSLTVTKSGTTPADFLITIKNASALDTGPLEAYVRFHG